MHNCISKEDVVVNHDHKIRQQTNVGGKNNTKGSLNPREGPSVLAVQNAGWNREGFLTWW